MRVVNISIYAPSNHHKSFHLCGLDSTDTSNVFEKGKKNMVRHNLCRS